MEVYSWRSNSQSYPTAFSFREVNSRLILEERVDIFNNYMGKKALWGSPAVIERLGDDYGM